MRLSQLSPLFLGKINESAVIKLETLIKAELSLSVCLGCNPSHGQRH
jgi:hypothetical protein